MVFTFSWIFPLTCTMNCENSLTHHHEWIAFPPFHIYTILLSISQSLTLSLSSHSPLIAFIHHLIYTLICYHSTQTCISSYMFSMHIQSSMHYDGDASCLMPIKRALWCSCLILNANHCRFIFNGCQAHCLMLKLGSSDAKKMVTSFDAKKMVPTRSFDLYIL
jgi:hypothetical protein